MLTRERFVESRVGTAHHIENIDELVGGAHPTKLFFKLMAGGHEVGPYVTGQVQEKITNQMQDGEVGADEPWAPPGADVRFRLVYDPNIGVLIYDFKTFTVDGANPPLGDHHTYTQENRILWTDLCGNPQNSPLGSFDLKATTTGATVWQVKEQ